MDNDNHLIYLLAAQQACGILVPQPGIKLIQSAMEAWSVNHQIARELNNIYFILLISPRNILGFPGGSMVKNPPANAGDAGLIPGSGRSSGEGNGNPPQYSCLGNLMDRGLVVYSPWSCKESDMT